MTETRKHFTAEQKMTALRRHLLEHVPVSDVCDAYGINPTVFYRRQDESTRLASSLKGARRCSKRTPGTRRPPLRARWLPLKRSSSARTRSSPSCWKSSFG
jgi:transposase-like protein